MSVMEQASAKPKMYQSSSFTHLVIIEPLGFLYGSAGKFLSPENLVGRSGDYFPPSATTLSGLFAQALSETNQSDELRQLQVAGPFWSWQKEVETQNFYVPTPLNCLVKNNQIEHYLVWKNERWQTWGIEQDSNSPQETWIIPPDDKYQSGTWLSIQQWHELKPKAKNISVFSPPWEFLPHLHPHLQADQRHTLDPDDPRGSLFLENSVQLNPDACLVYLSNVAISSGWYRFGGEGHLVDLRCEPMGENLTIQLHQQLGQQFALITPAIWGSNRLSYRAPVIAKDKQLMWGDTKIRALLTQRPQPTRHRFGQYPSVSDSKTAKILSRGRYVTPGGTVYVLENRLDQTWQEQSALFPVEGVSFQRWGCGLALPLFM
jgi:CRISPR-associated protein Cmr3